MPHPGRSSSTAPSMHPKDTTSPGRCRLDNVVNGHQSFEVAQTAPPPPQRDSTASPTRICISGRCMTRATLMGGHTYQIVDKEWELHHPRELSMDVIHTGVMGVELQVTGAEKRSSPDAPASRHHMAPALLTAAPAACPPVTSISTLQLLCQCDCSDATCSTGQSRWACLDWNTRHKRQRRLWMQKCQQLLCRRRCHLMTAACSKQACVLVLL